MLSRSLKTNVVPKQSAATLTSDHEKESDFGTCDEQTSVKECSSNDSDDDDNKTQSSNNGDESESESVVDDEKAEAKDQVGVKETKKNVMLLQSWKQKTTKRYNS